jgi:hypothetical protein
VLAREQRVDGGLDAIAQRIHQRDDREPEQQLRHPRGAPREEDVEHADAAEIDDGDDAAEDRPGDRAPDDGVDLEQVVPHDRVADREREEQHRQGDEVEREAEIEQVERDEAGDRDREGGDAAERGDLRALARRGGRRAPQRVGEAGDEDHPAGDQRHRVQTVDEEDRGERAMKGEVVGILNATVAAARAGTAAAAPPGVRPGR